MYDLILWQELDPLLTGYTASMKRLALRRRKVISARIESVRAVSARILAPHADKLAAIARSRVRRRLLQKGVPATEALDAPQTKDMLKDNLNDDEKMLLKLAYRKAAAITHPDKGGSVEDFQAVKSAYESGDLTALNEYLIARELSGLRLVDYWVAAAKRPDVQWAEFQATNEYALARMYQQGRVAEAINIAGQLVEQQLCAALAEETSF